MSAIEFKVYN